MTHHKSFLKFFLLFNDVNEIEPIPWYAISNWFMPRFFIRCILFHPAIPVYAEGLLIVPEGHKQHKR